MKKVSLVGLTIFLVLAFGLVSAMGPPEDAGRGRETAMSRIEENLRRFEERVEEKGLDIDMKGLRVALENIMKEEYEEEFCHEFTQKLEYEDEGDEVENLQKALEIEGYFEDEKDGVYDWSLARAVYDFQKEEGIELEGGARFGFALEEETRDRLNQIFDCEDTKEKVELTLKAMDGGTTDPEPETYEYEEGEEVTVEAIPDEGYQFNGWEREGSATECDSQEKECAFEIKEDSTLAAHFGAEEEVVYSCDEDADCRWVSTNCCPENEGANWECVNEEETELDCPENTICPQVISPRPTSPCECIEGDCEGDADTGGQLQ